MPERGKNGRFISNNHLNPEDGFMTEIRGFLKCLYKCWRYVPLLFLIFILWRFLGMTSRFRDLRDDLCGCTTSNGAKNEGEPSSKKDYAFK